MRSNANDNFCWSSVGGGVLPKRTRGSAIAWCLAGLILLASGGCGELEPMIEPEVSDLQLTVDTLKSQVRDAQKNLAELRAEMEARRQELAEAHVARAQLEGRLREAERRLTEARQVVNLQREELTVARAERERISRSSAQLQGQLKQMQKRHPKGNGLPDSEAEEVPTTTGGSPKKAQKAMAVPGSQGVAPSGASIGGKVAITAASMVQGDASTGLPLPSIEPSARVRAVSVMPGDTLWKISRKYRVGLERLRSLNHMTDDHLIVGQAIWIPIARPSQALDVPKAENRP